MGSLRIKAAKCHCEWYYVCREHRNEIETKIRDTLPVGMYAGTELEIRFIIGFELFNTVPYHNYETWSQGWNIKGHGIHSSHEFLDKAVDQWIERFNRAKTGEQLSIWETYKFDKSDGFVYDRLGKIVRDDKSLKVKFDKGK